MTDISSGQLIHWMCVWRFLPQVLDDKRNSKFEWFTIRSRCSLIAPSFAASCSALARRCRFVSIRTHFISELVQKQYSIQTPICTSNLKKFFAISIHCSFIHSLVSNRTWCVNNWFGFCFMQITLNSPIDRKYPHTEHVHNRNAQNAIR